MRIDDLCLVVQDVDRSDGFYSGVVGLERRMRNVRFVDFTLGGGARLAMWVESSIAETVGATYPRGPGMPFSVTLELESRPESQAPDVLVDPDGFTIIRRPSATGGRKLAAATLAVSELERSAAFLAALGLAELSRGARSIVFDGGTLELTITDDPATLPSATDAAEPPHAASGGRLMLAVELETGAEVDVLWELLRARGLADSGPPQVYEWGSRSVYFVDDDGYIWEIYAWVQTPR